MRIASFIPLCVWQAVVLVASLILGVILEFDKFSGEPRAYGFMGNSVAINGSYAVVGAYYENDLDGRVYVYRKPHDVWRLHQTLTVSDAGAGDCTLGSAVALHGDYMVVGASNADDKGAAYVFQLDDTVWSLMQKLVDSAGSQYDLFGSSVAISGTTIAVGAPKSDAAANEGGAVVVFLLTSATWTATQKLTASDPSNNAYFGHRLAMAGARMAVAASRDDETVFAGVYMFSSADGITWDEEAKLAPSDADPFSYFGSDVALSEDASFVAVGCPGHDMDVGAVYIYTRTGTTWAQAAKLTADYDSRADWDDQMFGWSVAMDGGLMAVGAPYSNARSLLHNGVDVGRVYLFEQGDGPSWSQTRQMVASDATDSDMIGKNVAISGTTVISGAVDEDIDGNFNAGAVYFFRVPGFADMLPSLLALALGIVVLVLLCLCCAGVCVVGCVVVAAVPAASLVTVWRRRRSGKVEGKFYPIVHSMPPPDELNETA
ncbi:FG-GAP repeat [Carpediemonas membranifera]|uniref:FG-GAP repeat n=1 Tax=Carpediemonas membranifera TaxID=201153 RepID=A0A8J6BU83_9EUKA|nr:FG-GAP repeat [Carpediemonas membranifera]|eukprot:KAG9390081.1 FG-GAP repeat [Carpediemonas membranifera]